MKNVLAAIIPEAKRTLSTLIADDYATVTYVHKFDEALNLLNGTDYDLVVCGVHFDDSRSIEFLQRFRKMNRHHDTPFVMLRTDPKPLGPALSGSVQLAVKELGGNYFDVSESILTFNDMKEHIAAILRSLSDGKLKASM